MSEVTHVLRHWRRTGALIALLGLLNQSQGIAVAAVAAPDVARGKVVFVLCAGCHGEQGEGIEPYGAPRLSHLQDWYVLDQLKRFREFKRGGDPADPMGQRMQLIAAAVKDPIVLGDVVAYIETLPTVASPVSSPVQVQAGANLYAVTCTACHGGAAEGNPALRAPRLAGGNAWYISAQLEAFRSGLRGRGDPLSAPMAAVAQSLAGPEDMANIAAYLSSLPLKP